MFVAFEARDGPYPLSSYVPFPESIAVHQQAQGATCSSDIYLSISRLYMIRAHVLIIRRSKLHHTASGIFTPIGGRLVQVT